MKLKLYPIFKLFFLLSFILFFTVNYAGAQCTHVPLLETQAVMSGDSEVSVSTVTVEGWDDPNYYYEFTPVSIVPTGALILYPGGLVDIRAYAPLARDIASAGYLVALIQAPNCWGNAAVSRPDNIINAHPEINIWSIGGHSQGGVTACGYISNNNGTFINAEKINGLVLWDTFPPFSMLPYELRAISIYRTFKGNAPNYDPAIPNMPADTAWVGIEGGIHEYYGWYGDDETDYDYIAFPERPLATLTREEQQEIIVDNTISFLAELDNDLDNCPDVFNPNQADADDDGIGDACDNGTIYGTVSGIGREGIPVNIYISSCGAIKPYAATTTNTQGYYGISGLENGRYLVVPDYAGYSFNSRWVDISPSEIQVYDFTATLINAYAAAGGFDDRIIEQAQIMTTNIEDTGIEVRATEVNWLEFGGSYAGFNSDENWVQPYYNFTPEDMSAYPNAPLEINGIINTKMKSKDGIEDKFGITLEGEQGTCADVQEEIYVSAYSLLSLSEQQQYLAEGKSLVFIPDDNPGNEPDSNPVLQSSGWLPVDPAENFLKGWGGTYYTYEPLGLYVPFDDLLAGDDERYKGVYYCKILSHQAILSWMLTKSFEDDPVLITPSAFECIDPGFRPELNYTNGSCLFWFSQGNSYYCSDYVGPDFTPESAATKCASRGAEAVYSSDTCSVRDANGEIEAAMPAMCDDGVTPCPIGSECGAGECLASDYVGHGALCDVHCMEGNEFIWNAYTAVDPSDPNNQTGVCGGFPIFYP